MNTGQMIITIFTFALFATILTNFYRQVASTGDDITGGQDGILATAVATSWSEVAQGLAYDEITADTSFKAFQNPSQLSAGTGIEAGENKDSVGTFNDFDDFNGATLVKTAGNTGRKFTTTFEVHYVDTNNVARIMAAGQKTFTKRMDMKTWRSYPPAHREETVDTLRTSIVLGYFFFR